MSKWIRWQGLLAFILVFGLLAVLWLVVVDWLAEKAIETAGTRAVGAKVDVAKADVTLFPAGIVIHGLEVTDADRPMTNAVAVKRLNAAIELPPVLRRKIIVNDLRVEGLAFNTPRKRSGALPGRKASADATDLPAIPPWLAEICGAKPTAQLNLPTVEDILGREPLQTLQLAKDIRAKIDASQTAWQDRLKDLPDQKDFDVYKKRIEKIKGSGGLSALLGAANEAKSLQAGIQADLKRIKDAQNEFKAELQALKKQSAALAAAPAQEARRLREKYALSPKGVANLSRALFGPQACGWWQKGYAWYQRVKPYMGRVPTKKGEPQTVQPMRGKGVDVRFAETHPLPDFLIRQVHLDAQLDIGSFTGQAADITSQPHILGKPTTFKFLGRQLRQIQAINLNGMLNLVNPDNPQHNIKMFIEKLALENFDLSKAGDLPLSIAQALTDLNMNLELAGPKLDARLNATLQDVKMALKEKATTELSQALGQAVASVHKFGVSATVKGTDPKYVASLKSDLDKILANAVGQLVKKASAGLEKKLRQTISQKVKGPIGDVQGQMSALDALGPQFAQRLNLGNDMLKDIKLPF